MLSVNRSHGRQAALARSEQVAEEHKNYQEQTRTLANAIETLEKQIIEKRIVVEKLDEIEKIEDALANIRAEQKRVLENLENVQNAHKEIEALKPKVLVQDKLEGELAALREKIAVSRAVETQMKSLDERIERLRNSYRSNSDQLKEAEAKAKSASDITALEKRDADLINQLANLRAKLESDQKFQSEIKNGLCPILSEKCLNLKDGKSLAEFLSTQFSDITSQIALCETEKASLTANLKLARDGERVAATISGLKHREAELKTEGTHLSAERRQLEDQIAGLAELEKQQAQTEAELISLGDPKSRIRYLENETGREMEFRESLTKIESNLERLESEKSVLVEELDEHQDLIGNGYDKVLHAAEKAALHEAEKHHAEKRGTLEAARQREKQLADEMKLFAEMRKSLQNELREKERLESVAEATAFIRDTLKEAAPRVARNYVHHVSLEANQMFREITGNGERTLKWADDYSIRLEEDGYERPFQSLSGGEQMAAALSIRLALLKQLTDIRIAFFDEPTTNMDAERRENLAQQISRITHFDQLFVISHDDTFDGSVDNVISI